MTSKRDYYEVLDVKKNAAEADIKKAYRRLAMKFHPDRNDGDKTNESEKKFKEVKEAYETLSDRDKRSRYDTFGHDGVVKNARSSWHARPEDEMHVDVEEIYRQAQSAYNNVGGDVKDSYKDSTQYAQVPLHLMISGGPYVVLVQRQSIRNVRGIIASFVSTEPVQVIIPKNSKRGDQVVINDTKGRVTLLLVPESDRNWGVENLDLHRVVLVDIFSAMLGDKHDLYDPYQRKVEVKIPSGSTTSTILRLRGKGLEDVVGRRGDMYLRLNIKIPTLSDTQKEVLREAVSKIRS